MDSLVGWNDELAAIVVNKPETGEQITIAPGVDQGIDISAIAALDAQFYQTGSNLWIIFEDGAIIVVEGYFEGGTEEAAGTPRSVVVDGETFTGEEFLTAFSIDDLPDEFAEGDVGAPETQQNGASFDDPSLGPLGNDPNGIGLLSNTLLSPTTTALNESDPAFEDTDPIIGAIETGFLDEDALLAGGSVSITGSLNVDFGANDEDVSDSSDLQDTPTGAGNRSITFDAADVGAAVPLESGGVPLNFVLSEGDTVLTAFANGTPVFEIRLFDDGAGSYQFTLFEPLDHPDSTSEDDLGLTVSFTATDSNGDTASATFSVSVNDDVPEVVSSNNETVLLDDDALTDGNPGGVGDDTPDTAFTDGTLDLSFGADGGSVAWLTDGAPDGFTYELNGTTLEIRQDGRLVIEVTLNETNGDYSVAQIDNILHTDGDDENNQDFTLTYQVTDGDGDTADGTLTISVDDDTPDALWAQSHIEVDEGTQIDTAVLGQLQFSPGADGASVTSVSVHTKLGYVQRFDQENVAGQQIGDLEVGGFKVTASAVTNTNGTTTITGTVEDGNSTPAFELIVNADGSYEYTQFVGFDHPDSDETGADDKIALRIDFTITDGDGDTDTAGAYIRISDDGPAADGVQSTRVDEDGLSDGTDFRPGSQNRNIDLGILWGADGAVGQRSLDFADSKGDAVADGSQVNNLASLGITATHQGNWIETFTSDGVPVLFTISDNAEGGQTLLAYKEGTTGADGHVFSINLNTETTQYEFQLLGNLDHPADGNVPFSSLTPIVFTVHFIAEDGDGDTVSSSFEIELQDDQPEGTEPNNVRFDEDRLPDGGNDFEVDQAAAKTVQTQSLNIAWGADNDIVDENDTGDTFGRTLTFIAERGQPLSAGDPYSQSQIDIRVAYSGDAPETSALSSGGAELVFKIEDLPNGGQLLTAYKDGGTPEADAVFKVTLDPTAENGAYTVEMIDSLDHGVPDAGPDRNNIQIDFGYQGFDADGDAIKGNLDGKLDFKITIDDDAPVIDADTIENGVVEEEQSQVAGSGIEDTQGTNDDDFRDGFLGWRFNDETTHEADGSLGINWGADDANPSTGVGANDRGATFASNLEGLTSLTSRGDAISYELSDDGTVLTATASGRTVFTVSLSDEDNGSYEFTLVDTLDHPSDAQGEDSLELTFDFVATDSDGDTADASFDVTVIDDQPITFGTILPRFVEEEGLGDGNQDGLDFGTSATGLLNIYWGGDDTDNADNNSSGTLVQDDPSVAGQRSVIFSDANNGPIDAADVASFLSVTDDNGNTVPLSSLTSNGEVLTFNLSNNGTILTAEADGQPVFTVTLSDDDNLIGSGSYTFDLLGTLDHPIAGNSAGDEDVLTFAFDFTASDGDGDIAIGNFEVRVVDDSPIATGESRVLVDEDDISNVLSTGSDPFDGNRDGSLSIPAILGLGFAAAAQGDLLGVVAFGADGAAESGQYGFVSDAADEMSAVGLTSKGQDLSFVQLGNTLIGYIERRGSADEFNPLAGDRPVLSFTLNPDTGIHEFRLYDQLDHVEGNGENTALVSADGPINAIDFGAVILATDDDGDTVELTDKVLVTITDDVPVVDLYLDGSRALIDESPNRQGDDTNRASVRNLFNEIDDQDKGTDPNFGRPQYARDDVVDWDIVGTDEPSQSQLPANIVASLKITNENDPTSGFTTTIGDYPISLVKQGDLIVGRYNDGLTEKTAFAVHIDGQGRVSIVQYVALNHDDPNRTDESIGLNGKIDAVLTVTDYDGDRVEEVLAIGHKIRFDDDAPSASRDTVDVVEDQPETFSVLDNDDLGADGVDFADVAVVRGPSKGTLEYNNQTGEFTYTPNANENGTDSFRYSITDGDGDTSEATVRINIAAVNDAPEVSGNLFSAVFVTETEDTSDLVKTRELKITDVDLSDQHVVTIDFNGVSGGPAPGLTDQEFIDLIEVGSATQNGADRSVPITFKASSTAFDYLAAGEKVTFSYKLTADDQNGGGAERNFNVVVTGTNDGPVITQAQTVGSVHEPGAFSTNINGTSISFNPALGESGEYRISGAGVGGSQTFDTLDGLVQALAGIASGSRVGGNSLQDAGPASGGFPNIISTTGGLLSLGGNSVAGKVQYQFSSEGAAQDFLNEVLTPLYDQIDQADSVASATEIATKGVIKFTDADLTDAHVFTATSNDPSNLGTMTVALNNGREATGGNTGEIAWRYSVDPDALNFLAEGETRQESFTVMIDDENGGVVSRVVTITQVGANDAPILSVTRKNNVDETTDSSDIATTINATFTDVDVLDDGHVGEVFLKSVNGNTGGNSKADFAALDLLKPGIVTTSDATTDGTVAFDFSAKSTVFDYLADGETVKLNYRITVEDEHGGRGSKEVDIIITGTNDAPEIVLNEGVISYELLSRPGRFEATLDYDADGSVEQRETLATSNGQTFGGSNDVDGDGVNATLHGNDSPRDLLNVTTFGQFDDRIGMPNSSGNRTLPGDPDFQQQVGTLRTGNGGLTIDSGGSSADPTDGSSLGGNFGDEGTGNRDFNNGEIMRFALGDDFAGTSALVDFLYDGGHAGTDVTVRLISNGTIIDEHNLDLDDGQGLLDRLVADGAGGTFDTIEIISNVGASFNLALADLDIAVKELIQRGVVTEPGSLAGVVDANASGGLEAVFVSTNVDNALLGLQTTPSAVKTVLGTVQSELNVDLPTAIAVVWDYLDDAYVGAGPNQPNINEAFVRLGVEYAIYLESGGAPLLEVVAKFEVDNDGNDIPQRQQSLHDNLLGNLNQGSLNSRFDDDPNDGLTDLSDLVDLVESVNLNLLQRDVFSGNEGTSDAAARAFDEANGYNAPSASGQLFADDVDNTQAELTWSLSSPNGTYGNFSINANTGEWTYELDSDRPETQALEDGDMPVEMFAVTVSDGAGGTDIVTVSVTVNGSADTPAGANILIVDSEGVFGTFTSIQSAIDADPAADVIFVVGRDGDYPENIEVDRPLSFKSIDVGEGNAAITPTSGTAVLIDGPDFDGGDVKFDGIDLIGTNTALTGIDVEQGSNVGTLSFINGAISGFDSRGIFSTDNGTPTTTPTMANLVILNVVFDGNGTGSGNTAHVKLFGYDGDALFQNVSFAGTTGVAGPAGRPDSAVEIVGGVNSASSANPVPANEPNIGTVVFNLVTVTGEYHKNPIAIFNFDEVDGLSISDLDLSGAQSNWGPLFNIDGVADLDIDASGFGILFPTTADIHAELQGDKPGQPDVGQSITGTDGNDFLRGRGGDDALKGNAGNDFLVGDDFVPDASDGVDTAVFDGVLDASNVVAVADLDPGTDTVPGWQVDATASGEGLDRLVGVEIVQGADPDGAGGSTGRFLLVGNGGFATIQEAVDASVDGDTILIAPGTYTDPVSIDGKAITLIGKGGPDDVIIEAGAGKVGVTVSGIISGDVTVEGITFQNSDSGVSSFGNNLTIGNLVVQNSKFLNNAKHGVFVNGKNDGVGKVTVQDSTFENNGDGSTNGDGDIVLFEYRGDATLKNLIIDHSSGTADTAIQIAGFEQNDYDVNDPIGVVVIDNVQIDGTYTKVALYIQGYTDLTDLSLSDVSGSVEAGWGYATYIDPMSSAIVGAPPNVADRPGAFNDAAADGSVDLSGVTLANTVAVGVDPGHPLEPFNGTILQAIVNGTPGGETIIGTEGVDLINGRDGDDVIFGGLGSDIKSGGGGEDTFILNDLSSVDTILDYTSGEDKIDLSELLDGVTLSDANKADYVKVEGGVLKVDRDGQGGAETFEDAANLFSDGTTAVTTGNVTIIDNADTTAVEISIAATA